MKKLATAIATIALIGTPAFAADIAVKAAAPSPAPVYNWTGWYVGVNAGASFGNVKTDFNGAPLFADSVQITPGFGFSDRVYPSGFIGGGQIGYNWQYSPLIVVGLEADFQGALEKDSTNFGNQPFFFVNADDSGDCGCTSHTSYTAQIEWFGTARVRIGYVWGNGEVMSYLTGGLAYGEVRVNGTNTVSGLFDTVARSAIFSSIQTFDRSHVNTGWVVGYGTEGKLLISGWTYKIEGLWMDLGTLDIISAGSSSCVTSSGCEARPPTGGQVTTHTHFTDGILRGGLNYKFY